jgi:hypothetical protein
MITVPRSVQSRGRRHLWALAAILVAILVGVAPAAGELTQSGNLFVRFDGGLEPRALPRHALAPIAVRIEGTIRAPTKSDPPALRRIRVALNRAGRLDTRGLPGCPIGRIRAATTVEAISVCGPALVGSGGLTMKISLPEQPETVVRAEILLFNGIVNGRQVIVAHVYQHDPVRVTRIIVFRIGHGSGAFGTVLEAAVPPSINRTAFIQTIFLQLQRRYVYRGKRRSYLSASCSVPPGLKEATFPFARASVTFEDGRTLSSTMIRSCRAR